MKAIRHRPLGALRLYPTFRGTTRSTLGRLLLRSCSSPSNNTKSPPEPLVIPDPPRTPELRSGFSNLGSWHRHRRGKEAFAVAFLLAAATIVSFVAAAEKAMRDRKREEAELEQERWDSQKRRGWIAGTELEEKLRAHGVVDVTQCVFRAVVLYFLFLPWFITTIMSFVLPFKSIEHVSHALLRKTMGAAGPTFIKLGQWMSTRPDVFSPELIAEMNTLTVSAPPHRLKTSRLLKELGIQSLDEIFEEFEEEPLHSGCVGQVHRGRLRAELVPKRGSGSVWRGEDIQDGASSAAWRLWRSLLYTGQLSTETELDYPTDGRVVVKVLHPNIEHKVRRDLVLLTTVVHAVSAIPLPGLHYFGMEAAAYEFSRFMLEQLDLTLEADHLDRFRANFADNRFVHFPLPIRPFVSKGALVESLFDGEGISDFQKTCTKSEAKQACRLGLSAFLKMLFTDNFMHCDLHPGNILVTRSQVDHQMHLCLVDAGLVSELSPRDFDNFVSLFSTVVIGDGAEGARLMMRHARENKCPDVNAFCHDMQSLYDRLTRSQSFALLDLEIGRTLTDILDLVRKHKVMIEANYTTLMVGIIVLEGLGRSLDPSINLITASVPYLITALPAQVNHLLPVMLKRYNIAN